jgi:phage baseplate assembly protein gpV
LNRSQAVIQKVDRRGSTKILVAAAVVSCALVALRVAADETVAPLSVPVKVLPSSQGNDSQDGMQNQVVMQRPRRLAASYRSTNSAITTGLFQQKPS